MEKPVTLAYDFGSRPLRSSLASPGTPPPFYWRRRQKVTGVVRDGDQFIQVEGGVHYQPFLETPDAWQDFAAVLRPEVDPLDYGHPGGPPISDEQALVADRKLQAFVRNYGLPAAGDEMNYETLFVEAVNFALAVSIYSLVSATEESADRNAMLDRLGSKINPRGTRKETILRGWQVLAVLLRDYVGGTHVEQVPAVMPGTHPAIGRYWTCDTLLTALWQQLFNEIADHRVINLYCGGCGRPFAPTRANQHYCDESCRNRANQRAWRERQQRKGNDGS